MSIPKSITKLMQIDFCTYFPQVILYANNRLIDRDSLLFFNDITYINYGVKYKLI